MDLKITNQERAVVRAWLELNAIGDSRKSKLNDTGNLFRFFAMVRNLMLWMDDLMRQMSTSEKPRDVSGVELLMNNHQGHKAEIDAREDNFADLYSLGKELLSMQHYASNEIKEKLRELTDKRNGMIHRWEERWEHLQLILEVYQFARDAAVAEAWLIAQDPYLKSDEFGQYIDEVENLIKKHEAFEKAAAAQEERFAALERLTTFELKDMKRRQDEEMMRQQDLIKKQAEIRKSGDQPDSKSESGSMKGGTVSGEGRKGSRAGPAVAGQAGAVRPPSEVRISPSSPGQAQSGPQTPKALGSRRSSTASDKKRGKSMTRSKSPFRSFRFKKKQPAGDAGTQSDDEENFRAIEHADGVLEGTLIRKHEWETTTKKASNRSWDKICVVLRGSQILFYKDSKTFKSKPEDTFKGEAPVDLVGGTAEVATDYTKKKNVFRLKLQNGGDYLFQANDDEQMNLWVESINRQVQTPEEAAGKSQTLPPGSDKKDEPKRRSFFTLKKN